MKLIEVILYAQDMPTQVVFYRDIIGLPVTYPQDLDDFSHESWVTFDTGACSLALHTGGEKRTTPDTPMIVFGIDDIHAERERLVNLGVEMGMLFSPAQGKWVAHGVDPEGNPFAIEKHE